VCKVSRITQAYLRARVARTSLNAAKHDISASPVPTEAVAAVACRNSHSNMTSNDMTDKMS